VNGNVREHIITIVPMTFTPKIRIKNEEPPRGPTIIFFWWYFSGALKIKIPNNVMYFDSANIGHIYLFIRSFPYILFLIFNNSTANIKYWILPSNFEYSIFSIFNIQFSNIQYWILEKHHHQTNIQYWIFNIQYSTAMHYKY